MIKQIFSYEKMKGKILCQMVCREKNSELPEDVVRFSYLDISVIFCVFPEGTGRRGTAGFRVTGEMLKFWNISQEKMMRDAFANTRSRYRYIFRDLSGVIDAINQDTEKFLQDPVPVIERIPAFIDSVGGHEEDTHCDGEDGRNIFCSEAKPKGMTKGMYTLINQDLFNSSVILLFPDLLEPFADLVKADLIILPSSVNELICLTCRQNMDFDYLRSVVQTVNRTCVGINEKLSDSIYVYLRGKKRVEIISEKQPWADGK